MEKKTNQDLFFGEDALSSTKHRKTTKKASIKDRNRYYRLLRSCFFNRSEDVYYKEKLITGNDIKDEKDGKHFFKEKDIHNFFYSKTEFYCYPSLTEYQRDGEELPTISSENVSNTLLECIKTSNSCVILKGNIGSGKTALFHKLALDLRKDCDTNRKIASRQQIRNTEYIPIIFNFSLSENVTDNYESKTEEVIKTLTRGLYSRIIHVLEENFASIYQTKVIIKNDNNNEYSVLEIDKDITLKIFLASKGYTPDSDKNALQLLRELSSDLWKYFGIKLVLFLDNLDTICYSNERFMLFEIGFNKFNAKIGLIKKIVEEFLMISQIFDTGFMVSMRPYVCDHVLLGNLASGQFKEIDNAIFKVGRINPHAVVNARIEMLCELLEILYDNFSMKNIQSMTKEQLKINKDAFEEIKDDLKKACKEERDNNQDGEDIRPLRKLLKLSNQGFRGVLNLFQENVKILVESPKRLFSHDSILINLLNSRLLYSQLNPKKHQQELGGSPNFPNLFLVRGYNYTTSQHHDQNEEEYKNDPEKPYQKHRFTYWLKYIILYICYIHSKMEDDITVEELVELLCGENKYPKYENTEKWVEGYYDRSAVLLAIGSLITANKSRCIKMCFKDDMGDTSSTVKNLIETTRLQITRRGRALINGFNPNNIGFNPNNIGFNPNNIGFCFSFIYLQLMVDDWLLPLPHSSRFKKPYPSAYKKSSSFIYDYEKLQKKEYSYEYLTAEYTTSTDYFNNKSDMVRIKAKLTIIFLSFLKSALNEEKQHYNIAWEGIQKFIQEHSPNSKNIFNDTEERFKNLRKQLLDDINAVGIEDEKINMNYEEYSKVIEELTPLFDAFFNKVLNKDNPVFI